MATNDSKKDNNTEAQTTSPSSDGSGSVQKIRVKVVDTANQVSEKVSGTVSEGAVKAKKLANASSAVLHGKLVKAKRIGLLGLKKAVELLTPRNNKKSGDAEK